MADTPNTLAASSPTAERALYAQPTLTVVSNATGAVTATIPAVTDKQALVYAYTISYAATITSAHTVQVKDGSTVIWQEEVPTITTPAPITRSFERRPLHGATGGAMTVVASSPGSISCTISVSAGYQMKP